jgi:hypothetical protein
VIQKQPERRHRRHRNRAEADQLAAEYEASGLTRDAFCGARDVPLKTLCRYVRRYRSQKAEVRPSPRLVQVEVAGIVTGNSALTVLLHGGRRIEVNRGFDTGTLRQLVTVLEQA